MKEVQIIAYLSDDGKTFSTKEECLQHENLCLTVTNAFKKIQFCDSKNTIINYFANDLSKIYFEKCEDLYEFDIDEVYIIRVSKDITDEELTILNEFFNLIDKHTSIYVPAKFYAGITHCWDENENRWRCTEDMITEITREYHRIRDLETYVD